MNAKNVLMLVILSAGMLAGLTATTIQATPAYADTTDDCKHNGDKNCNERSQDIKQKNDCKVEDNSGQGGDAKDDSGDGGSGSRNGNDDNKFQCLNGLVSPNTGNDANNGDNGVSNEPGDVVICHRAPGNPSQSQTLSLSQNAAESHLLHHAFDTPGPCPT